MNCYGHMTSFLCPEWEQWMNVIYLIFFLVTGIRGLSQQFRAAQETGVFFTHTETSGCRSAMHGRVGEWLHH